MAQSNRDYWRKREEEARKHEIRDEEEYRKRLAEIYRYTQSNIEKEINGFYARYAARNGITMAEARKRASKADMEDLSRKAAKYVAEKDFSDQANEEMALYNLTMKANRLELLKANIGLELIDGFNDVEKEIRADLTETALKEYARMAGILGASVRGSEKHARVLVNASFRNATFSERVWAYQSVLKSNLERLLTIGIIQGRNPNVLMTEVVKAMKVSEYEARLLLVTEMCRLQTEVQKESYERNGYEQYIIITCGEDACEECQKMDGRVFFVKDMAPGDNAPPFHPFCRCSTAEYADRGRLEELIGQIEKERGEGTEGNSFTPNSSEERGRIVRYGKESGFEQYGKTVHAKKVNTSGNNMYIDSSVQLTRKEVRELDYMISTAKELHDANYKCNAPFVITDNAGRIASYNPRTNTFFVDYRLADPEKVLDQQQGFAAPNNIYSTIVHELFHWKDAEDYRSTGNSIDRADFKSPYSQHNRSIAKKELRKSGIDISNPTEIANISQYAYLKWLENDLEEVYTEYRTKELLKE